VSCSARRRYKSLTRKSRVGFLQDQQFTLVTVVTHSHPASIIDLMISLARCLTEQRIIVAGSKSIELAFELNDRGFSHVASTANCGHARGQYDVALVDWRKRTFKALDATLDWLVDFLRPEGLLVIWVDAQKSSGRQDLCAGLERRGFLIEDIAVESYGTAVSARRRQSKPLSKAA
jgi:hypothetical protein